MAAISASRRLHKKQSFLKAFAGCGKIREAARAARISRDAVHDWRQRDQAFAAAFAVLKRQYKDRAVMRLSENLDFFCSVVKPLLPSAWWSSIERALQGAIKSKAHEPSTTDMPSRMAHVSMPHLPSASGADARSGIGTARLPFSPISELTMR